MKRSEFLKRLGLGIGAAVAAPALLRGEENSEYDKFLNDFKNQESVKCTATFGKPERLIFWRQENGDSAEQDFSEQFLFDWSFHKAYP